MTNGMIRDRQLEDSPFVPMTVDDVTKTIEAVKERGKIVLKVTKL